jgi:hypothetical protein
VEVSRQPVAVARLGPQRSQQRCAPRGWPAPVARVFWAGFGLSLLLLTVEYLTAGAFPGWLILVPSNPTTLLAALVGHGVETTVGVQWADEAFFATLAVESALWWYAVGVIFAAVRRRHFRRN